ncbi:MAG: hypothetical protein O2819_01535 [Planctomycetota bacterium]|nr:hypothetical protein [Planctomycetota bacterium]MDA1105031.1 hypothetical protein [Planctomycetota bacterium]
MAMDGSLQPGAFTGSCAIKGVVIEPGARYVATLVDRTGDDGQTELARADVSLAAWESGPRPDGLLAFWHSTAPRPDERRTRFIDDDTLLEMVHRLADATEPRQRAFRWVLALLLLRKRVLRQDSIRRADDGTSWWIFRRRGLEVAASFEVADPGLADADLASLTEELASQLGEIMAVGDG